MADKEVLSQDELDALLTGVRAGDVEVDEYGNQIEFSSYDLTSQDHISRCRFPALDLISEKFSRTFRTNAYSIIRKPTEIQINGTQIIKFKELVDSLFVPSSLSLIRINPLRGMGMVMLEPNLVFRFVDTFFGGTGRVFDPAAEREYTRTEVSIIRIVIDAILLDLKEAWKSVFQIDFSFMGHESNVQMAQICQPSDLVVVSSFTLTAEGKGGDFMVVLPYSAIEPIRNCLESTSSGEDDSNDQWTQSLQSEVMGASVEITSRLHDVRMSLRQVMQLKTGDVIAIDEPDALSVEIQGVSAMRGRLGTSRNNLVVEVEKFLNSDEASESLPPRVVSLLPSM